MISTWGSLQLKTYELSNLLLVEKVQTITVCFTPKIEALNQLGTKEAQMGST